MVLGKKEKKLTDLKGEDVGLFIRAFDNEYLPDKSYYNYSPTGDVIGKVKTKAGLDSKIAWGSTGEIGKGSKCYSKRIKRKHF